MVDIKENVRIDKWLWAARFFKTRALASQAVNGGKVHLNGSRVKSARVLNRGDRLLITKEDLEFDIIIVGLSTLRRPAVEARLLYEESPESSEKRRDKIALKRMFNAGNTFPATRPNKRDRRKIREFIRENSGGEHEED